MAAFLLAAVSAAVGGRGQELQGHVDVLAAGYPVQEALEARARAFVRIDHQLGTEWFLRAAGYVDGVVGTGERPPTAILRPHELYLDYRSGRLELRVGLANVVWGVLDEIQPTDRVNPLDVARFVLEGRGEARLPVPMLRGRLFLPRDWSIEALWAPWPRSGTFDQLDEPTSPFNPARYTGGGGEAADSDEMEWGVRLRHTDPSIDWSLSFYRDVSDFDFFEAAGGAPPSLRAVRPVRSMLGGDFETVLGKWGLRGEFALDFDDPRQVLTPVSIVRGTSSRAGIGVDRRVGDSRLFLNALHLRAPVAARDGRLDLVAGLSSAFGRGRRELHVFGLWSVLDDAGFARAILSTAIAENLRLIFVGGIFLGRDDAVFGLGDADFLAARLRVFF